MAEEHEDATILFCLHMPRKDATAEQKKFASDPLHYANIRAVFTGTVEQRRQKIDDYMKIREEEFAKKGRAVCAVHEIVVPANPTKPRGMMKA